MRTAKVTEPTMRFKVSIMEAGPIPPSGGPNRERYLERNGLQCLADADAAHARVIATLGFRGAAMPSAHPQLEVADDVVRRDIQRDKRTEWINFVNTLDRALIDELEPHVRRSEAAAVAALNYLEDHELADTAHLAIHRAAFIRRGLYGCPISTHEDGAFWTDCSMNMSHLRAGMSAELVSDFECSICGELVEDCVHVLNNVYNKVATMEHDAVCSICRAVECEHVVGASYPVVARATARNLVAEAVAMVARPRYPQARMVAMTLDLGSDGESELMQMAASQDRLHCDGCLGPCKGLNDMRLWGERGSQESQRIDAE